MGLDIYLSPAAAADANKVHYSIYDEDAEGHYPRESMTDEQYAAHNAAHPYVPNEGVPSQEFPDHICNRRYLRSSYNEAGFNRAVPNFLGVVDRDNEDERGTFYWIFAPLRRDWRGQHDDRLRTVDIPALGQCENRALEIEAELRKCDPLRVTTVSPNIFMAIPTTSADEALAAYRALRDERGGLSDDDHFSTRGMEVFGTGLPVLAAMPGRATLGETGVHLIYRAADESLEHYAQAAKIAAEFCAEAIMLIQRDGSCEMSWSG